MLWRCSARRSTSCWRCARREGATLAAQLEQRLARIEAIVTKVRDSLPVIIDAHRQRLHERVADFVATIEPQRLEQEMVLLAARYDVAEELDRLATHVSEGAPRALPRGGSAGRRLDFLMQEFNREANTLGSKSVDPRSTQAAVSSRC